MTMDKRYCLFSYEDELIVAHIEGHPRWIAKLSNGLSIYQDDFRQYPEFDDERRYSTWTRLRNYCYAENIDIVGLTFQFRTNRQIFPENRDGYYFCKAILGGFGLKENLHFYVTGTVYEDKLLIEKWRMPELIPEEREERVINPNDICLILNSRMRKN